MAKLIITTRGSVLVNGYRIRDFKWSEEHKAHIYLGREIDASEFNAVAAAAYKYCLDLDPRVRVVSAAAPAPAPVSSLEQALALISEQAPEHLKSSDERAMTADAAEEVLLRERPERLKKKSSKVLEIA